MVHFIYALQAFRQPGGGFQQLHIVLEGDSLLENASSFTRQAILPSPESRLLMPCTAGGGPERLRIVLEGESLLNDASSITLFTIFIEFVIKAAEGHPDTSGAGHIIGTIVKKMVWLAVGERLMTATARSLNVDHQKGRGAFRIQRRRPHRPNHRHADGLAGSGQKWLSRHVAYCWSLPSISPYHQHATGFGFGIHTSCGSLIAVAPHVKANRQY